MNDMLKSWVFWKPILIVLSLVVAYFAFLFFIPPAIGLYIACAVLVLFFLVLVFWMAKAKYDHHQYEIARNYEKLTGKKWNE